MITRSELIEALTERAAKRYEKYKVTVVDRLPTIESLGEPAFVGIFSITLPKSKQRLISSSGVSDIFGYPQTVTEITRDYLDVIFPDKLRATYEQVKEIKKHRSAPQYARKGQFLDYFHVDIKATYYSMVNISGWNVDYYPGKFLSPGRTIHDYPLPDHKIARVTVVSAGLLSEGLFWTGEKLISKKMGNKHTNYGLWSLTMDMLHWLAQNALTLGAVYVNTDGYILPRATYRQMIAICENKGLIARLKGQGDGEIYGIGSYLIGNQRTVNKNRQKERVFNSVRSDDLRWLSVQWEQIYRWRVKTGIRSPIAGDIVETY